MIDSLLGFRSIENPSVSLSDPAAIRNFVSGATESVSGVSVSHETVMGYAAFRRGVTLFAETMGRTPLHVYVDGETQERDSGHPADYLLSTEPNPEMTAYDFKSTMEYYRSVAGNAVAYIERGQDGMAVGLWPCPPGTTRLQRISKELIYETIIGGQPFEFPADDALHIKGIGDGLWGRDPVKDCNDQLGLGMAATKFGAAFFKNGSSVSLVIRLPRGLKDKEAIEHFREVWGKHHQGPENAHKPHLLEGEGAEVTPITTNNRESQVDETRMTEIRIGVANILGLPAFLLGDTTSTSYNSLEILNKVFLNFSLGGRLTSWRQECQKKLLRPQEYRRRTHTVDWTLEALEEADKKTEIESIRMEVDTGLLLLDEARRLRKRKPFNQEWSQKPRKAVNIGYADDKPAEKSPTEPPEPESDPPADPPQEPKPAARMLGTTEQELLGKLRAMIRMTVARICERIANQAKRKQPCDYADYLANKLPDNRAVIIEAFSAWPKESSEITELILARYRSELSKANGREEWEAALENMSRVLQIEIAERLAGKSPHGDKMEHRQELNQ